MLNNSPIVQVSKALAFTVEKQNVVIIVIIKM